MNSSASAIVRVGYLVISWPITNFMVSFFELRREVPAIPSQPSSFPDDPNLSGVAVRRVWGTSLGLWESANQAIDIPPHHGAGSLDVGVFAGERADRLMVTGEWFSRQGWPSWAGSAG
jgi:hypothetical protein